MSGPLGTGGFEPRTTPAERRDFFDIRKRQSLAIKWLQENFRGLIILGRVPTEADLPPAPNRSGDGWLTDDPLDHLWIWVDDPDDPPARWIDTGPIGVTDHDALDGVTSSQHHVRYSDNEAIAAVGPHFSGLHSDLTDLTPDNHHPELHDLDSHVDVAADDPGHGQALGWDVDIRRWVPQTGTGEPGPPGEDGQRGEKIYVDNGPPLPINTPGAELGDQYIDALSGDLYTLN